MQQLDTTRRRWQHRAFLDLDDIDAQRNPGVVYGVYVNLPPNPSADDLEGHRIGNLSLFGIERARDSRGDRTGHTMHLSMEVTDWLDKWAADGRWTDGEHLEITLRPIMLDDGDSAPHPDTPVDVGRVSLHFG